MYMLFLFQNIIILYQKNDKLVTLFQKTNIVETIRYKRLLRIGCTWRSQNPHIRIVLEEDLTGKRPLGRLRLRWEDVVKKDMEALSGGIDWRKKALDRKTVGKAVYGDGSRGPPGMD
jgi:hypothetical protein